MARRLESLIRDPRSIQKRLSSYREGISALSSWLYDRTSQPPGNGLLDRPFGGTGTALSRASFWQQVSHFFKTFFASFLEDYNTVGGSGSEEGITVWANIGRDQIQVIKNLVVDQFTPQTGIDVTLSVVQTGFIEATLAGRGPDVAIGMARGQPVNLACRNALLSFDSYGGFEDMKNGFPTPPSSLTNTMEKPTAFPVPKRFSCCSTARTSSPKWGSPSRRPGPISWRRFPSHSAAT